MRILGQIGVRSRRLVLLTVALPALLIAPALLLPLCVRVWLPDLWSGPRTLAEVKTPTGHHFRVVQAWGTDFYMVELVQTLPNGTERRGLLDGDAGKWWRASLSIDESRHRFTVNDDTYRWPRAGGEDLRLQTPLESN